jgi:hypothetical protein
MSDLLEDINNSMANENGYEAFVKMRDQVHGMVSLAKKRGMCYDEAVIYADIITYALTLAVPPYKRLVDRVVREVYGITEDDFDC